MNADSEGDPFATPKIAGDKQEPTTKSTWITRHPMQKCDHCSARVANGEIPVCVAACGAHALDFGDFNELKAKYTDAVQLNSTDFPYAYLNRNTNGAYTDTKPMFLIRKRKTLRVY